MWKTFPADNLVHANLVSVFDTFAACQQGQNDGHCQFVLTVAVFTQFDAQVLVEQAIDAEGFSGFLYDRQTAKCGNGQVCQFVFDADFF